MPKEICRTIGRFCQKEICPELLVGFAKGDLPRELQNSRCLKCSVPREIPEELQNSHCLKCSVPREIPEELQNSHCLKCSPPKEICPKTRNCLSQEMISSGMCLLSMITRHEKLSENMPPPNEQYSSQEQPTTVQIS